MCWCEKGAEIRSTNVYIDETYTDKDGTKYKVTEKTYNELMDYIEASDTMKIKVRKYGKQLTLIGSY
jgi:hypothetical protein